MSTASVQRQKVDTRVVVETPEGVDFQFIIAGPGTRASAWLLDMVLKLGILAGGAIGFGMFGFLGGLGEGLAGGLILITWFMLDWFYGSFFEGFMNGQTPGKRSGGLRVVRTNGTPIDFYSAAGRNFLRAADMLPLFYTVGLISMLMTRRMQRLGDLYFDTMVIDERREWINRTGGLTQNVQPLVRSECPRRYSVPERTLSVIERLFESDRVISDARREEIARPLSEALRARLGYLEPQPDPRNPHLYFRNQGVHHTQFILRVLKTFAADPSGTRSSTVSSDSDRTAARSSVASARRGRRPSEDFADMLPVDGDGSNSSSGVSPATKGPRRES
ncbi:MAG: RDD family protein [Planctomycetota bacterium]